MQDKETKRLFVAVAFRPEAGFADKFARVRRCTCHLDRTNWVNPSLFHLTLKFLGETETSRISAIAQVLKEVAADRPSFSFTLDKVGAFGSRYQPRVVWLGAEETPQAMLDLHRAIDKKLERIGFARTFGNFVCHLTLARINFIDSKKYFWEQLDACENLFHERVDVKEIVLYESILQKGHAPQYIALERFPLNSFPE